MSPSDLWDRLRGVDTTSLADAGRTLRVLPPGIAPLRRGLRMLGRAVTADAEGDLMSVIAALARCGSGDVLVVRAGSDDRAVAGELFATEALRRGVTGLVIDGLCRDSATLVQLALPVYARGTAPHACEAQGLPRVQEPVEIGGVRVEPGDLLLGDDDGVVVLSEAQAMASIDAAEEIQEREVALQREIAAGGSLFDHLDYEEHLARLRAGEPSRLSFS